MKSFPLLQFPSAPSILQLSSIDVRTDEVTDIEGLVVAPKSVVDVRIPTFVSSDNVISGGDGRCNSRSNDEEEYAESHAIHQIRSAALTLLLILKP
ncbi:hypothetical protein HAX54_036872 [Datura stramonium]|uniref:Uncharacterized protein n=1 Tax=Datura stramonium TaxID=4076 RepID=A0ABS8VKP3_DATST|nr:hypothetical protein [Datura stramonium]